MISHHQGVQNSPHFHTGFLTWPVNYQGPASQTQLVLAAPLCSQCANKGNGCEEIRNNAPGSTYCSAK